MAFNLGRPALFAGEATVTNARRLLDHPLSIPTDSRLVATCELLTTRRKYMSLSLMLTFQFLCINLYLCVLKIPLRIWTKRSVDAASNMIPGCKTGRITTRRRGYPKDTFLGRVVSFYALRVDAEFLPSDHTASARNVSPLLLTVFRITDNAIACIPTHEQCMASGVKRISLSFLPGEERAWSKLSEPLKSWSGWRYILSSMLKISNSVSLNPQVVSSSADR